MADGISSKPTVASLCTGIRGLDLAVERYFGAETAWYSEIEKPLVPWLADRLPGVPNHGDLKLIDWGDVEPTEILTAGYPCQPFSGGGLRKGIHDPRHLWPWIIEAIRHLRPRVVVLENVQGHLSKGFDVVLQGLAEAGFDAEWCLLRASDVGAPHQRARVWIVATDADRLHDDRRWNARPRRRHELADGGVHAGLTLLPTPVVNDMGEGKTVEWWDTWCAEQKAKHGNGNGHGPSLAIEALRLLPTPTAQDSSSSRNATSGRKPGSQHHSGTTLSDVAWQGSWGKYEPAIRRWEGLTRPAPVPTIGVDGIDRLNPAFVGWMQGYDEGTEDGLTRTQALKAFGNSVCQQQALASLDVLVPALLADVHTEQQLDLLGALA